MEKYDFIRLTIRETWVVLIRQDDPPLTATSVLVWKRGQPFSLAATKFIEHIQCFLGIGKP